MQIGSEMAALQEKNPKMNPKKRFFLKNPPGFLAFEKSSSKLTSKRPFWLNQIYRDIKFILRGLPERCETVCLANIIETEHISKFSNTIIRSFQTCLTDRRKYSNIMTTIIVARKANSHQLSEFEEESLVGC